MALLPSAVGRSAPVGVVVTGAEWHGYADTGKQLPMMWERA